VFHKTTPELQDQDQDLFFLVSDRSYPKTDGLRPHHRLVHEPEEVVYSDDDKLGLVLQEHIGIIIINIDANFTISAFKLWTIISQN